jgi:hypothetical protein
MKDDPLINALNQIAKMNKKNRRKIPDDFDNRFIPKRWKRLFKNATETDKRRFIELCALDMFSKSLKSGDIWVEGSIRYADFKTYLIPESEWISQKTKYYNQLQLPTEARQFLQELKAVFNKTITIVNKRFPSNEWAEIKAKKLLLSRIDPIELPPEIARNKKVITSQMPSIKIQDLLIELDRICPYTQHFTHLGGQQTSCGKNFRKHLFAAFLAEGCNLGYKQTADACPEIDYAQLLYVGHWFLSETALRKAIVELVNFQNNQPLATIWGDGKKAMADGKRFPISTNSLRAEFNPRYFGHTNKGGVVYSHFSDQHSQFYIQIINCSPREAIYLLDGVLNHETTLSIEEIFTDTHGYTE